MRTSLVAVVVLLAACGARHGGGPGNPTGNTANTSNNNGAPPADDANVYVYAHSDAELYKIDPDKLTITLVGAFQWSGSAGEQMTDIAIDKDGNMVGISFGSVYAVDKTSAATRWLAYLDRELNGLSFVPAPGVDPSATDILMGSALDGTLYEINPSTGVSTVIGNFGGNMQSSGDIVSVRGFGTVATVKYPGGTQNLLARVDPTTGAATIIGATAAADIWGLGFWKSQLFGFTAGNDFVLINPSSGVSSRVSAAGVSWWGAAVSTAAPVVF